MVYKRLQHGLALTVNLAEEQTAIFAFVPRQDSQVTYVISHSRIVEKIERGPNGNFIAFVSVSPEENENVGKVRLSNLQVSHIETIPCPDGTFSPIDLEP